MRFRTDIHDVSAFYKIIQAVERLQKRCIFKFGEKEIRIICNDDVNEGGIQVWSQIKVPSLFTEYRIQSNSSNQITLRLAAETVASALRSAIPSGSDSTSFGSDAEVVMKLSKKNEEAVLSFEIYGSTSNGRLVQVMQDVHIEVMRPNDVDRLKEPMCPEPDVHILLPPLSKMRTIIDRLRPLSDGFVAVRANGSGCLQVCAQTDNARVDVTWNGLTNPVMSREGSSQAVDTDNPDLRDRARMYGVVISLKSLQKFLNSYLVSTTTIACICQSHCVILYVYIGDMADAGGVLTFYIPAALDP